MKLNIITTVGALYLGAVILKSNVRAKVTVTQGTHLSPSFVIVKVHSCSHTPSFLVLCFCRRLYFLWCVNKLACKV